MTNTAPFSVGAASSVVAAFCGRDDTWPGNDCLPVLVKLTGRGRDRDQCGPFPQQTDADWSQRVTHAVFQGHSIIQSWAGAQGASREGLSLDSQHCEMSGLCAHVRTTNNISQRDGGGGGTQDDTHD